MKQLHRVCTDCGGPIYYPRHPKQRRCESCISNSPYDFTFKQGNCTIQLHTEFLSDAQITKMMRKIAPLRRPKKRRTKGG